MAKPIFFDPERKRWKRLRLALNVLGVFTTALVAFFAVSMVRATKVESLNLPEERPLYRPLKESEKHRYLRKAATHRKTATAPSQVVLNSGEGIRAAFYVTWDAGSYSSLKEYGHQIDLLFPEWLHMLTPDGRLQAVDEDVKLYDVIQNGRVVPLDQRVMKLIRDEGLGTEVFPLLNNFDPIANDWDADVGAVVMNPAARVRLRQEVATFLASDPYRGLTLDFEGFPFANQSGYRTLIAELAADLHAKGMKLYVSVPARNEDFDFTYIAAQADGLIVMDYDQHFPGGPPGPVAAQDWFVDTLKRALTLAPREKIICSIANYGYNFALPAPGQPAEETRQETVQQAWLDAQESEADVELDPDSLNPHYSYLDEQNVRHDVWFVDAVTALNQMRAARALGIQTFALWRLGAEDRSLWRIWDAPLDPKAPDLLRDVPPGHDVDMEGDGEVLRIEQRPVQGARTIHVDPTTNQIDDETFTAYPLPYQIARYGASKDQVAITFDDGPDPNWTPKILDVLKLYHAPATFFVIGEEAERYHTILERMYAEGHELGNHTFSHPDISDVTRRRMGLEVNATERLFESELGAKPVFFRPPYGVDQEPDTDDQVRPLEIVQDLGYTSVGAKLDPHDWQKYPHRRSTNEILYDKDWGVLTHLPPCRPLDQHCGNIILLHDGGGDRSETLRALPLLIAQLRARGFAIVPVSTLLHKTRAEVMPPLATARERWAAWLIAPGFWGMRTIVQFIVFVFFVGDALMSLRFFVVGAAAILDRLGQRRAAAGPGAAHYQPAVAVLIPAFNEETVIERTVRAALDSDYPRLRVVVVDDGSADATFDVVQRAFAPEIALGRVVALTQANAGKAEALNYGLQFVTEEIFIGIDADTVIAPHAIARLVPHFLDQRVAAVAGNAKVGNRVNVWTRWQALEYITSQNFERRALNTLSSVSVVPGALGAWRTAYVREAGAFHLDTVAEDADLTMALLRRGHRVQYEDRALAFTEAPINARGLMRQRFRWSFGILQSVWKHRGVFARKGVLGLVALPNILIFQILLPLVSPMIDLLFVVGVLSYLGDRYFHPLSADASSFHKLLLYFLTFLIIDFVTSAIAFALERRGADSEEQVWLLGDVWLQRFVYRQLFSVVLFRTLKRAFEGKSFAWDKLERTARMSYAGASAPRT